jgi:hypothetical protein
MYAYAGIVLTYVPSCIDCMGMVVRNEVVTRRRRLLWRVVEFLDTRYDVFVLYIKLVKIFLSVETVYNKSAAIAIHIGRHLHGSFVHHRLS